MALFGGRRKEGETKAPPASSSEGGMPGPGGRSSAFSGSSKGTGAGGTMANIGKSISIKGDLSGSEDLVIDGSVEGKIELPSHQLTVGSEGKVRAEVHAKNVVIVGRLIGNVNAAERVEIQAAGSVEGDIRAPHLALEEGALLNGSVETGPKRPAPASLPRAAATAGEKTALP